LAKNGLELIGLENGHLGCAGKAAKPGGLARKTLSPAKERVVWPWGRYLKGSLGYWYPKGVKATLLLIHKGKY